MTRRLVLCAAAAAAMLTAAAPAHARGLELAVHDQGADPAVLADVAEQLGARTARIITRTGEPRLEEIRELRDRGLKVQAAIIVKRWTTPADVVHLVRQWRGQVATVSVGNEPELNGVHACTYARLFRRSYALLKQLDPTLTIGIREASPFDVIPYTAGMRSCRGVDRLRADFYGIHPYCPDGDPLAPCKTRFESGYTGIGNLARVKRYLRARSTRRWLSRPNGSALPIRVTELSYFAGRGRPEWAWPRAVRQARKHAEQLVVYGLGPVHEKSLWPSAALLDRFGAPTSALEALAHAVGRRLRPRPAPRPHGDFVTVAPDGDPGVQGRHTRVPPVMVEAGGGEGDRVEPEPAQEPEPDPASLPAPAPEPIDPPADVDPTVEPTT